MQSASPAKMKIVVAMSGGVDSSVTAALMKRAGHEVIGITLRLYGADARRKGACCAGADIYDARRVAEKLDIAHYVLDYEERFRARVIADFAETYARGETPIPCVRCNERVKFADLMDTARDLGAAALATGHYVRRVEGLDGPELHAARDASRDQSYFLFTTTRAQLDFLRFPLGDMEKREVRSIASELGLPVAAKPDSQDICFVPDGDYAKVVAREKPEAIAEGEIVDEEGRVLGRHPGVAHFTVGQRKGLGLSGAGAPLFVLKLDAEKRRVVVGPRTALATGSIFVRDVNWLVPGEACEARRGKGTQSKANTLDCTVKVRSMRPAVPARVAPLDAGGAHVAFGSPEEAVAPGQACVFYDGARVLGGGWIAKSEAKAAA
jgi:tRNA-specific 2-thiouridylase